MAGATFAAMGAIGKVTPRPGRERAGFGAAWPAQPLPFWPSARSLRDSDASNRGVYEMAKATLAAMSAIGEASRR